MHAGDKLILCVPRGKGELEMLFYKSMFLLMVGLLFLGGLLSFFTHKRERLSVYLAFTFATAGSLAGIIFGVSALLSRVTLELSLKSSAIPTLDFSLNLDALSAFFIVVISTVSLAVSVFSFAYMKEYIGKHNVGVLGLLYNFFLLSMIFLVASGTSFMFLFCWELMSLISYFLVVSDHRDPKVRQAGFIYIVMTHIGTVFIILAFLLLFRETGSFSFAKAAELGPKLAPGLKTVIFLLVTLGFGTKAGIVPLHIWLPKAHPAAPSNVSALMSGIMLKTAIYGFVRVVVQILGGGPVWWGVLILTIGAVSALLGVMYALMEHDIKRLLAYHSVENIGIILMGIGVALIFMGYGLPQAAVVALAAGLFHVFNHAVFKGLLFLGAGAVHYATGTRDIEKMGGLLRRMPWTGFFFLIGSISISALPPFNGFVSEWLTFQSLLMLGSGPGGTALKISGPVFAASLALTGALAAACFVKAFGIQFLAQPRSVNAERAKEVPVSMRAGMGILALLSFVVGVFPVTIIKLLSPVTAALLGVESVQTLGGYRWLSVNLGVGAASVAGTTLSPLLVLGLLAAVILVVYIIVKRVGRGGTVRVEETWNCGMELTPQMEYTATSFSKPIRIIFRRILFPTREVEKEYILKPYFTRRILYKGAIKPVFEDGVYRPLTGYFLKFSAKMRFLQSGSIHLYVGYIFVTLVVLLIFAR
ncbi:hydrogenase 4 subunit B [Paradesulfitobacterium aromaticivorans]